MIIAFIEPFGDSILLSYGITYDIGDIIVKNIISSLFLLLIVFSFPSSLPRLSSVYLPIYLFFFVVFTAFANGLIFNIPRNALNDFTSFLPIILLFFVRNYVFDLDYIKLSKFLIVVLAVKYLIYQSFTIGIFGVPSWKILMKQSPALLVCFSILLGRVFNSKIRDVKGGYIYLFVCFFLILVAQSRMLIISTLFIIVVNILISKRKRVILYLLPFFVISFFVFLSAQDLTLDNILDHYSGDLFDEGLEYRNIQFHEILNRITESPILGKGLGYFNPKYLDYSQFAKPYQLELDLFNFISKIGTCLSFIYFFGYFLILVILFLAKKPQDINDLILFYIGVISLLIYSVGQTFHQGYLFWLILLLFFINFTKRFSKFNFNNE
ncbi:MAG: hypothetical protein FD136_178 [Chitinophagaceae bacterium]|nr:MAG: hypothetical protein FD136_178 [Chitinophagaceae bacterium]